MGLILFLILIHVLVNIFYNLPSRKKSKKVVDTVEVSVIIFILSMRIGEDNENIRRRSKDVKNGYKIRCNKKIARIE